MLIYTSSDEALVKALGRDLLDTFCLAFRDHLVIRHLIKTDQDSGDWVISLDDDAKQFTTTIRDMGIHTLAFTRGWVAHTLRSSP
jgi:hypothetical protein